MHSVAVKYRRFGDGCGADGHCALWRRHAFDAAARVVVCFIPNLPFVKFL
jgi:hypothetical protein